jgi:hypothetical protein
MGKQAGLKSFTLAYYFLTLLSFGIYQLISSIFYLTLDSNIPSNVCYFKE